MGILEYTRAQVYHQSKPNLLELSSFVFRLSTQPKLSLNL